jgi:hypothetical protein
MPSKIYQVRLLQGNDKLTKKWLVPISLVLLTGFLFAANLISDIEFLLLIGLLLVVRLSLPFFSESRETGTLATTYRRLAQLQLPLAMLVCVSLLMPPSLMAGLLALPWLIFTLLAAGYGLLRWLPRPYTPLEEFCIDVGLLYAPISIYPKKAMSNRI